jgi:hypothetical protein
MKKLSVGFLAVVLALSLGSCSTIETDFETPQEPLLKSYKLKRDASGAYSIDYNVADKTESNTHKNLNSLTNEIYLSKVEHSTKDQYRNEFNLDNNKLSIGFIDEVSGKRSKLTIADENIILAKGNSEKFLKSYSLSSNNDNSIQLEFEVNNNVSVDFQYNNEEQIYEVHLKKGDSGNVVFSRSLTVPDTGILKLNFVNYKFLGKGTSESVTSEPEIIINTISGD